MDNQSITSPKPKLTPMDFFLYLGFVIALVAAVVSFINLSFDIIERLLPDPLNNYYMQTSSMQSGLAFLIISFPVLAVLARIIRKTINKNPEKSNLSLRKWVIYAVLFISGLTFLGDIITLIKYFLMGDMGAVFVAKVLVVLLVAVISFVYFIHQLTYDNVWSKKSVKVFEYVSILVFVLAVVLGFIVMGSPTTQRKIRFDDQRLSDVQTLQWQIVNYYQQYGNLPENLSQLSDPLSSYMLPIDPSGDSSLKYEYIKGKAKYDFTLCANFDMSTAESKRYKDSYGDSVTYAKLGEPAAISSRPYSPDITLDNWMHDSGYQCFSRTIDPVRYPVYKKD